MTVNLDPGKPLTDEESTRNAREKIHQSPNLWPATLRYYEDLGFSWMELAAPEETHLLFDDETVAEGMIYHRWPKYCNDIEHTRVVAEIYSANSKVRPVIRIIRR